MKLFDESENKYYEFIAKLLNDESKLSGKKISQLLETEFFGEPDFEVTDTLFGDVEGEEVLFTYSEGVYEPILAGGFPIRNNHIEQQAAKSLLSDKYIEHFLSQKTISKIEEATSCVVEEWNPNNIKKKNVFSSGASETEHKYEYEIAILANAIREHRSIKYDNVKKDVFEYRDCSVFPVRIEYSILNDQFRVCAYDKNQGRFIKMNLETMENVVLGDEQEDHSDEYIKFLKENTKVVVLDVEPVEHVVERCFRIFSYYDRKARYDSEENKYRLEISYFKADEGEIIKDILSLGGYVAVVEPKQLQKIVYKRICAAYENYR